MAAKAKAEVLEIGGREVRVSNPDKRAPAKRPDWVRTVELRFPSGRKADELVVTELAQLVWMTNLGNIDLNPLPVRADDLDHPDALRVDLDRGPGVSWDEVSDCELGDFTLATMPVSLAERGDLTAGIDDAAGSLEALVGP
jgi:DNA primase